MCVLDYVLNFTKYNSGLNSDSLNQETERYEIFTVVVEIFTFPPCES